MQRIGKLTGALCRAAFFLNLIFGLAAMAAQFSGKPYEDFDVYSDTWVATDGAGRVVPGYADCKDARQNKFVGMFYWTWHVPRSDGPNDVTKIIAAAEAQSTNGPVTSITWPGNSAPYHWGEPELGYYTMTDPFVIRKHASMLADAGVDAVFFDTTNPPWTWKDQYEALCREYSRMKQQGARTPGIVFIAPFGNPLPVVEQIWRDLYKPGLWKDTWFLWDGKPLLLADPAYIKDPELLAFFTIRRPMPDYWDGPSGPDQWSWLEVFPQHAFKNKKGEVEQVSVGVAQNALPNTPGPAPMSHKSGAMGRSWHGGKLDPRPNAVNLGLNFEEQWTRAMALDPKFIFVTGWNEWTAGRYTEWSKYKDSDCYFPRGLFVDEYTQEYSRDCEPMRGGHTDNYYYQLASWVRRYKGVRPAPTAAGPSRISIDGRFNDWDRVLPEFRDTIGDVSHRNHKGYGDVLYTNDTGRNDFVILKSAYDKKSLFFYAQTLKPISPRDGKNWMLLLIDSDQNAKTGWLGYDYVINHEVLNDTQTTVKEWRNGAWQTLGKARYRVDGNGMEVVVPRAMVRQSASEPAFDFHWVDGIQSFTDVSELGVNGDSAPNRRWNFRFEVRP